MDDRSNKAGGSCEFFSFSKFLSGNDVLSKNSIDAQTPWRHLCVIETCRTPAGSICGSPATAVDVIRTWAFVLLSSFVIHHSSLGIYASARDSIWRCSNNPSDSKENPKSLLGRRVQTHKTDITNMPITRYAKYLKAFGQLEGYRKLLFESFNAATLDGLMCRNTLSVGWDGKLYDCDFNQMLDMQIANGKPLTIFDVDLQALNNMKILTADHCFGCTAGAGSSCQGALES